MCYAFFGGKLVNKFEPLALVPEPRAYHQLCTIAAGRRWYREGACRLPAQAPQMWVQAGKMGMDHSGNWTSRLSPMLFLTTNLTFKKKLSQRNNFLLLSGFLENISHVLDSI